MSGGDDFDLDVGNLDDCPCARDADTGSSRGGDDLGGSYATMRFVKRRPPAVRKPRSKGKGDFCVMSHKGKVVHCYESASTAERVAAAFTRRGKAGTEFLVKKKRDTR